MRLIYAVATALGHSVWTRCVDARFAAAARVGN